MSPALATFARLLAAHTLDEPSLVMLPANEKEAKSLLASGWPVDVPRRIFTGRPCTHGHVAPRQVAGYCCATCNSQFAREYNRRPEVRIRDNAKARRRYQDRPPTADEKAERRSYLAEYRQRPDAKARHRRRMLSVVAERRAGVPPWLTDAQRDEIKAIYDEAARLTEATGVPYEVDHIVPLKATCPRTKKRIACGLHLPWNLRPIRRDDNQKKRHWFDDWGLADQGSDV